MAIKDYREMYITTILTYNKESEVKDENLNRSYLASLTFEELKELAEKFEG